MTKSYWLKKISIPNADLFLEYIRTVFPWIKSVGGVILKMNHREITKKYSELLNKAEFATGRKEVVGLLKKAAKLKSQIEINH